MTADLIVVGKTDLTAVNSLLELYMKRINRYVKFSVITLPDLRAAKNLPESEQKKREGESILKNVAPGDFVVLLDDKGAEYSSLQFATWLQKRMASGMKRLVFVIGGAYGFSREVYARADEKLSLSRMTFSHQIVRAIFTEQLYRAFSILNNEPYHHE